MNRLTFVFLALGLGWILQLILSGFQTKAFHQTVLRLKRPGCKTAVGLAGSNLKGKEYVVIVVDGSRTIVEARRLRGFTVAARLKPAPELEGLSLDDLDGERPGGIRAKTWAALNHAAGFIERSMEEEQEEQLQEQEELDEIEEQEREPRAAGPSGPAVEPDS